MAKTVSRKSIIYDILIDFQKGKKSAKEAEKAIGNVDTKAKGMGKSLKAAGVAFAGFVAAAQIGQFIKQSIQLARQAEGIKIAFDRLNNPALLSNLRAATKGTVSDLRLMQAAVQAKNFKIPLTNLAKFFEFAQQRARATGESVDYLVQSIITGIGRKSALVLDNLGISAIEIQQEFKKTGDFAQAAANIIEREMANAGGEILTAADALDQFNVAIENIQTSLGDKLLPLLAQGAKRIADIIDTGRAFGFFRENLDEMAESVGRVVTEEDRAALSTSTWTDNLREIEARFKVFDAQPTEVLGKLALQLKDIADQKSGDAIFDAILKGKLEEKLKLANSQLQNFRDKGVPATEDLAKGIELIEKAIEGFNEEVEDNTKEVDEWGEAVKVAAKDGADSINNELIPALANAGKLITEMQGTTASNLQEGLQVEKDARITAADESITLASNTISQLNALTDQSTQYQIDSLARQRDQGIITEEQFQEKVKQLKTRQARQDKAFAIADATINIAKGIVAAIGEGPIGIAQAAIIAALGAAQIAIISSTPIPEFAEGVIDLQGPGTETSDSIHAKLSKGESVMTGKETRLHKPLLTAIREGQLDEFLNQNYIAPALALQAMESNDKDSSIDDTSKWYRQHKSLQENNRYSSNMLNVLHSIDHKLNSSKNPYERT